jgi:hypothetical protein
MNINATELLELEARLGSDWPFLKGAREAAGEQLQELSDGLAEFSGEDSSVVVFGSLARGEWTRGSDIDWTLLIDGQAYPEQADIFEQIRSWITERYKEPGREGTFGNLAFSHELIHRIGGSSDTNPNLTQRILLLLESRPIGRDDAYRRVIRGLLDRYIREDYGWLTSANPSYIPRFLQNDIARYWRTVAVDFAYKRRARAGDGWALRTVKLRLSRKLTYAAGLIACFQCSWLIERNPGFEQLPMDERARIAVEDIEHFLEKSPLDVLAWAFLKFPDLDTAARDVFGSYDQFIALLQSDQRVHLNSLRRERATQDPTFQLARELGHTFQRGLDSLFLSEGNVGFSNLTKTYGVF